MFKFDPISDSDIVWVRVEKSHTGFDKDVYLALMYLPPPMEEFMVTLYWKNK